LLAACAAFKPEGYGDCRFVSHAKENTMPRHLQDRHKAVAENIAEPLQSMRTRGRRAAIVLALSAGAVLGSPALADITVPMHQATEKGVMDEIGQVVISESEYGLVFTPQLKGPEPGVHGFHVHEKPSCEPAEVKGKMTAAGAAGGHLDPKGSGKHGYPWGDGHLGDLPALYVDAQGSAMHPVLAPRLTSLDDVKGHALMVHKGGDNHADHPNLWEEGAPGRLAA